MPGTNGPKTLKISERVDGWIKFTFDEPIFAFRIDIIDALDLGVGDAIVTVDGYAPVTFINDSTFDNHHVLFLGIIDWDGFTMVTIDLTYNPDKVYYDNLRFTGISEPATLAMFGLGLAGLGFLRRRRAV